MYLAGVEFLLRALSYVCLVSSIPNHAQSAGRRQLSVRLTCARDTAYKEEQSVSALRTERVTTG